MAQSFTPAEWADIDTFLNADDHAQQYGIPQRRDESVIFASWNIRKFGALTEDDGTLKKSAGATDMIVRFCRSCDLIAIQEVQEQTTALFNLRDRLNDEGGNYAVMMSDVTGRRPGYKGMAERSAFLYNKNVVRLGELASDLSLDRSAVLSNIRQAYLESFDIPGAGSTPSLLDRITKWFSNLPKKTVSRLQTFIQFIRTPHMVEFVVETAAGVYSLYCVNAHLVSGKNKTERELEFFALLEWLLLESPKSVVERQKVLMIMADLNMDFESNVDKRRKRLANYITSLNKERKLKAKVNFPFLDGEFFTNARGDETYDHIAIIADDTRWPRGRHNNLAGTLGPNAFDYGMFDFTKAFVDAGPGKLPNGDPDFDRFSHDLSDHMPIWMRMPLPKDDQHRFIVDTE